MDDPTVVDVVEPSSLLVDVDDPMLVDVVALPPVLVDDEDPMLVDVVALPPELVDVVPRALVDVVAARLEEVDELSSLPVVGVEESGAVTAVDGDESLTDTSAEVAVADVMEVDVPSSPLAQATPTTASAATTDVNIPSIFLIIRYLLCRTWRQLCNPSAQDVFRHRSRKSQGCGPGI